MPQLLQCELRMTSVTAVGIVDFICKGKVTKIVVGGELAPTVKKIARERGGCDLERTVKRMVKFAALAV